MRWTRPSDEQLKQFASQISHVRGDELRTIEEFLPEAETRDFRLGLLAGLKIAYEARQPPYSAETLAKVVAVLAERIVHADEASRQASSHTYVSRIISRD